MLTELGREEDVAYGKQRIFSLRLSTADHHAITAQNSSRTRLCVRVGSLRVETSLNSSDGSTEHVPIQACRSHVESSVATAPRGTFKCESTALLSDYVSFPSSKECRHRRRLRSRRPAEIPSNVGRPPRKQTYRTQAIRGLARGPTHPMEPSHLPHSPCLSASTTSHVFPRFAHTGVAHQDIAC